MAENTPLTEEQKGQFQAAIVEFVTTTEEAPLLEVFRIFDRNGDGKVSATELKTAWESLDGDRISVEECERLCSEADTNGDGIVDAAEFVTALKKFIESSA